MTPSAPSLSLLRVMILLVTPLGAGLSGAQAAARNHDLQVILIPAAVAVAHDRAPGPVDR